MKFATDTKLGGVVKTKDELYCIAQEELDDVQA